MLHCQGFWHTVCMVGFPRQSLQAHPFWRLGAAKGVDPTPPKLRLPRETAFEAYVERAGLLQGGRGAADMVGSFI